MASLLASLAGLPLAAALIFATHRLRRGGLPAAARGLALLALSLAISFPHFTPGPAGTGEAHNYSLALADTLAQVRAGELPVLAGQSLFAWNGRIHPLRTAPYLFYLGASLDALTGRQLDAWAIQNLSLVLSLAALVAATYLGLTRGLAAPPRRALWLTTVAVASAAPLAVVYQENLFMTTHALPWIAVALGALARRARLGPAAWPADVALAVAVAALWLAHPPVAAWTTLAATGLRLALLRRAGWTTDLRSLAAAALVFALLGAYVVANQLTLDGPDSPTVATALGDAVATRAGIAATSREAFPGSLLPVTRATGRLSDLQIGAVAWLLALGTAFRLLDPAAPLRAWRALALALAALSLLLCLPVPGLHAALWQLVPAPLVGLTNVWPMQRLYPLALALIVFAAAPAPPVDRHRRAAMIAALLATLWLAWQAWPFLDRGLRQRWAPDLAVSSHDPSSANLTGTAYAFLPVPRDYLDGVLDPRLRFRLRPTAATPGVSLLDLAANAAATAVPVADGEFTLYPGKNYILHAAAASDSATSAGILGLEGPRLRRGYRLPAADGRWPPLSLWSDSSTPETVRLRFHPDSPDLALPTFQLAEFDDAALPIQVESWIPLRFRTRLDEGAWIETPRRYRPPYLATVDGRPAPARRGADGAVTVAVPAGEHLVELRPYLAPWARVTFFISAGAWLATGALLVVFAVVRSRLPRTAPLATLGPAAMIAALAIGGARPPAPPALPLRGEGPLLIEFITPELRPGERQVMATLGEGSQRSIVFIEEAGADLLRVGAEIDGRAVLSPPLPAPRFAPQKLTLATLPAAAPSPPTLRATLNERPALAEGEAFKATSTTPAHLGPDARGTSLAHRPFDGLLLHVGRTPVAHPALPRAIAGPGESPSPYRWRFLLTLPPDRPGRVEPLLVTGRTGAADAVFLVYADADHIRLGYDHWGRGGPVSAPIAVDYAQPLLIEVELASLAAFHGAPARGAYSPPSHLRVTIAGAEVLLAATTPHPTRPGEIAVGRNDVGLSSCGPRFSGILHDFGPAPAPLPQPAIADRLENHSAPAP